MYELFSAAQLYTSGGSSYWMTNSATEGTKAAIISENGSTINENLENATNAGVRLVGYLKKDVAINSGKGTLDSPYIVKR